MLQSDSGGLESSVSSEVNSDEEEEEIDKEKQGLLYKKCNSKGISYELLMHSFRFVETYGTRRLGLLEFGNYH